MRITVNGRSEFYFPSSIYIERGYISRLGISWEYFRDAVISLKRDQLKRDQLKRDQLKRDQLRDLVG